VALDKDETWLERCVLSPQRCEIFIAGQVFWWDDMEEFGISHTQRSSPEFIPQACARRRLDQRVVPIADRLDVAHEGDDVTARFVTDPPDPDPHAVTSTGAVATDRKAVMVVYGQDKEANEAMFDWLRAIGLEPKEWGELVRATGSASPFIGHVLDRAFANAQAVVVLFTPDEHVALRGALAGKAEHWRLQARPNVLIEAGMAFATHPDRTVLVVLGGHAMPSDFAGRHFVRLDGTVDALQELADRLKAAGSDVRTTGTQWLRPTRFPSRDDVPAPPPASRQQIGSLSLELFSPSKPAGTYGHEIDLRGRLRLEGWSSAEAVSVLEKGQLEVRPFVRPQTSRYKHARMWWAQNAPHIDQNGDITARVHAGAPRQGSGEEFGIVLAAIPKGLVQSGQKFDTLISSTVSNTIVVRRR